MYIKVEKAASTTLAGVAGRIAHKLFDLVNASAETAENIKPICRVRLTHAWSRRVPKPFAVRDHAKSFLFTFVRHPGRRSLSEFYFFGVDGRNATGNEAEPTATQAVAYLKHPKHVNSQFHMCADKGIPVPPGNWTWKQKKAWQIQRVVDELDYIGVVERMEYVCLARHLPFVTSTSSLFAGFPAVNPWWDCTSCLVSDPATCW